MDVLTSALIDVKVRWPIDNWDDPTMSQRIYEDIRLMLEVMNRASAWLDGKGGSAELAEALAKLEGEEKQ